jgi:hypothetical protein
MKGNAKLTVEQVEQIRKSDLPKLEIAALFGVSKSLVYYIKQGVNWKMSRGKE